MLYVTDIINNLILGIVLMTEVAELTIFSLSFIFFVLSIMCFCVMCPCMDPPDIEPITPLSSRDVSGTDHSVQSEQNSYTEPKLIGFKFH